MLDDTAGHPESVNVVFETVEQLRPERVHVVWAVRGRRGPRINRYNAEALAIWARRVPLASLVVTRSTDVADALNRVSDDEYAAFLRPLQRAALPFQEAETLERAVDLALSAARRNHLVLLLGAQGMNEGARLAEAWLDTRGLAERSSGQ
jgi:UDP-N-acetylmuramoyl-L-alanyl-D-glutamate--2,6-diaminopimelate ligase